MEISDIKPKWRVWFQPVTIDVTAVAAPDVVDIAKIDTFLHTRGEMLLYVTDTDDPWEEILQLEKDPCGGCIVGEDGHGRMFAIFGGQVLLGPEIQLQADPETR